MVKVVIIDDDPVLQGILTKLLESAPDMECHSTFDNLDSFYREVNNCQQADVLLLDIHLEDMISLEYLTKIKDMVPNTHILVHSSYKNVDFVHQAFSQGADGYILKGKDPHEFKNILRQVADGTSYVDPKLSEEVISYISKKTDFLTPFDEIKNNLSQDPDFKPRELQVLEGILEGKSYQDIADEIRISINTVRYYIKTLYRKFDVNNKYQLINKLNDGPE
jgi:DNA-binding NarL/FixJ family response regulator